MTTQETPEPGTVAGRDYLSVYPNDGRSQTARDMRRFAILAIEAEARAAVLAEVRQGDEVRRLLGYLWTATGKNHLRPVSTLFDEDDPIVADVERLAIFPESDGGPTDG